MAIPTWAVGQVLAASDVNNWFVPLAAVKTLNQSISSTTTLTNDTALSLTVSANAFYWLQMYIAYDGFTQGSGDLKWQLTGPSGATASFTYIYYPNSGGVGANTNIARATGLASPQVSGTDGAGVNLTMLVSGILNVSSTGGVLQFQWCQNVSSSTPTIVHSLSAMKAERIG